MPRFRYRARAADGSAQSGEVDAESRWVALDILARRGLTPRRVDEDRGRDAGPGGRRVSAAALAGFTRQTADLLESHVPLLRALRLSAEQAEDPALDAVAAAVADRVAGGDGLSDALARRPDVFSPLYVSLARAGETSGALDAALQRLADFLERDQETRARVRAALAYPAFIAIVGLGTVLFMMLFVVPRMAGVFDDMGGALPWPSRALLAASAALRKGGWAALPLVAALALFLRPSDQRARLSAALDRAFLRLPVWGPLARMAALARLARTLGALLKGGVPILESLAASADTLDHPSLRAQIRDAARRVHDGESLAEALRGQPDVTPLFRNMIAVGEEGNRLEKSLEKVAAAFERRTDLAAKTATSLLEPALILVVGGMVGLIVLALLLPIFEMPTFVR